MHRALIALRAAGWNGNLGKGSNTTSTQSSTSATPQAEAAYSQLLSQAQNVASTPYQAYTGELTAPTNTQQNLGIGNINANANYASPFINQAAGLASASTAPITAQTIQNYQNPYTQQVVNATNAQMQDTYGQQMASLQGNQIAQGALGGNATGVAKGVLAGQQALGTATTDANLYNQSYNQALAAAQAQQSTGLAGANALANYGISGQNAALTGATAQVGAGTLQQTTQQAADTANYGQYAQAQSYPYQQLQWLAGIDTGVGGAMGGTSSGSTTAPAPNQTAQYLGAGVTAAGLFLNRGGAVRARANGGGVAGFASGGAPGAVPWAGIGPTWIPSMSINGSAPNGGHAPAAPSTTAPSFDATKLGTGLGNLASGLWSHMQPESYGGGDMFSGDAYGGSSDDPLAGLSKSDYGEGFARGGVVGYAAGGGPTFDDRFFGGDDNVTNGDPAWDMPDVVGDTSRAAGLSMLKAAMPAVKGADVGVVNPDDPVRMPDQAATEAWRSGNPLPDKNAPVVAKDDDDETPAAPTPGVAGSAPVTASSPVMSFAPAGQPGSYASAPDAVTEPRHAFGLGLLSPNAKTGLMAAGLGMLASRSPNLGNAIGDGGIAGLTAYGSAESADQKTRAEAAKLASEARDKAAKFGLDVRKQTETERHDRATENKDFKPQLIHHTDPVTGQEVYGNYDPNTKKITPLEFPTSGDVKATDNKFVSTAPPVEERRKAPAASPEARDESYLKFLDQHRPPGYADIVRGVADYEMDPNRVESLQKGQRSQLYRDVKQYDPTYDQTHFGEKTGVLNSFSRGTDRAAVNSLNVSVSHLGTLKDLGAALENGNFPIVNRIINQAGIQTGGAAVTNFNAAKEIVGDEVVKAIVGGVSAQADRDAIKHLIMAQQSPAQLQGTINTFISLLGGQLEGRRQGYQAGTGLNNFDQKYLSPETREALKRAPGSSGAVDPAITRMVYPSGIPSGQTAGAANGAGYTPAVAAPAAPPPASIQMLKQNPALAPAFDQKYGAGASRQYLGQ